MIQCTLFRVLSVRKGIALYFITKIMFVLTDKWCCSFHSQWYFTFGKSDVMCSATHAQSVHHILRKRNTSLKKASHSTCFFLVGVQRFELWASWSQTTRATTCATPRNFYQDLRNEGCGARILRAQRVTRFWSSASGPYTPKHCLVILW